MRKSVITMGIAIATVAACGLVGIAPAQAVDESGGITENEQQWQEFVDAHPNDLAAQDTEGMKLFGHHLEVQFADQPDTWLTGAQAQPRVAAEVAARAASKPSAKTMTVKPLANPLPNDAFTLSITKINTESGWWFSGRWTFRKDFAGQTTPIDVASLQFKVDDCVKLEQESIHTWDYNNKATNLGTLRDAGAATKAPVWNVADRTSGFMNLAHYGTAAVFLDGVSCPLNHYDGAAAFTYDAIEGGSVGSVSASWGALSVSTSGTQLELQKSTQPYNFVY
jgi:hypothetical protein